MSDEKKDSAGDPTATSPVDPHPERFCVDYVMEAASEAEVRQLARELALEQTVELPGQIDAVRQVEEYTVGTLENVQELKAGSLYKVRVGFPNHTAGGELTQFLNVVFGNTSLKKGVSVANATLSPQLANDRQMFPGAKFGINGLRKVSIDCLDSICDGRCDLSCLVINLST